VDAANLAVVALTTTFVIDFPSTYGEVAQIRIFGGSEEVIAQGELPLNVPKRGGSGPLTCTLKLEGVKDCGDVILVCSIFHGPARARTSTGPQPIPDVRRRPGRSVNPPGVSPEEAASCVKKAEEILRRARRGGEALGEWPRAPGFHEM
jgi:hypothetical protein